MGRDRLIWRGEIHNVDLGSPVGHEPAFVRPAAVVSTDLVNNGPGALVVIVPIGSTPYGLRSHIEIQPSPSGLDHPSYARCDQIRVASTRRLAGRRGALAAHEIRAIDDALRFILQL